MSFTCHWMALFIMTTIAAVVVGVSVYPSSYVAVLSGTASFSCLSAFGDLYDVIWTRNGEKLREGHDNGVTIHRVRGASNLNLTNVQAWHNNSHIGCHAFFGDGTPVNASEALLQVQGPLAAVVSLTLEVPNSTLFLAWHPPFTLDIRGLDPDIMYCVAIVGLNVSGDETLLFHECDITETHFDHLLPPCWSWCYNIYCIVTPVNPAGNGESIVKPWNITDQSPVLVPPPTYLGMTDIELNMSAPVCTVELDLDTHGKTITLEDTDLTVEENSITFNTNLLTANRHYNVTMRASNAAGSSISYFNISVPAGTVMQHNDEVTAQPFSGSGALDTEEGEEGWKLPSIGTKYQNEPKLCRQHPSVVGVLLIIGTLTGVVVIIVCLRKHKRKASPNNNLINGCSSGDSENKVLEGSSRQATDPNEEMHGATYVHSAYVYQGSSSCEGSSTTCISQMTVRSEYAVTKETPSSRLDRTINIDCDDSRSSEAEPMDGQHISAPDHETEDVQFD